jgi:hypothetical protein
MIARQSWTRWRGHGLGALIVVLSACPREDGGNDAQGQARGEPPPPAFVIVDAGVVDEPPPPCRDDDRENDDSLATATETSPGATQSGRLCGDDEDWFALQVGDGCALSVLLEQVTAASEGEGEGEGEGEPIDAALSPPSFVVVDATSQALIGVGQGVGRRQAFNARVPQAGRYAVRVRGGDTSDVDYRLTLGVACGTDVVCPADDPREDNDSLTTAAVLDEGVTFDGASCGSDVDFFRLPTRAGCVADVQLAFTTARGDLDLQLIDTTTTQVLASSTGTGNLERIVGVFDPSTTVARVFLFNGGLTSAGNAYRLTVDEVCLASLGCPSDDPFEDNDTRTLPTLLGRDAEAIGAICGTDEDFFSVLPQPGCTTRFTLHFEHDDGDLDLQLLNSNGGVIGSSLSTSDREEVAFVAPNPTRVTARVYGANDAQNRYRFTVQTSCP